MDADGVVRLVAEIVRSVPNLPGAACVGRYDLFDEPVGRGGPERHDQERQRLQRGVALCRTCPARPGCPVSVAASRIGGQTERLADSQRGDGVGMAWGSVPPAALPGATVRHCVRLVATLRRRWHACGHITPGQRTRRGTSILSVAVRV
ncbi:MAG: hypothetical protein ACRDS1_15980 [Pseudonocardiaceae bacterium]